MTWVTEHPAGVYTILAIVAGLSVLVFFASRRLAHLSGALVALLLGVGVFAIDTAVVTDREQVELNTKTLAKAAQDGDLAALDGLFSDRFQMDGHGKASLMARAKNALTPGDLRTIWVADVRAKSAAEGGPIICHCNAGASGQFGTLGRVDPPYIGTMELAWEKEGMQWRITRLVIRSMGGHEQRIP